MMLCLVMISMIASRHIVVSERLNSRSEYATFLLHLFSSSLSVQRHHIYFRYRKRKELRGVEDNMTQLGFSSMYAWKAPIMHQTCQSIQRKNEMNP